MVLLLVPESPQIRDGTKFQPNIRGCRPGPTAQASPLLGGTTATNPSGGAQQPNLPKGNGDERDPERGGKKSQRNKASAVSGRQPSRQFACPYLFGGSLRHHCCRGFNRIGDVRQHLFRCHRQPAHYCPTCGRVFDDEQSSGAHIRQQNCSPAAFNFPGMTSDQWIDISTRAQAPPHTVPGGDAARWYIIWDILFPGAQRPPTPYINGSIFTVRLRDFAQRFLDNDGAWGLVYDLIPWWLPNVHPDYRQELHDAFEALIGRLVASAEAEDRPDNVD
ncbi:hypothetical protein PG995_007471 [Apiospora arundinis]